VFSVFTRRCLVAASNSGRSLPSGFSNCPRPQLPASHNCNSQLSQQLKMKVKVMLRPAVSRPVYIGFNHPSRAQNQIFITVRHLQVLWYGAPFLTRGRVCRLQLLLVLDSAVTIGSDSRVTHDHILMSQIRDFLNLEGQIPVFMSPRDRGRTHSTTQVKVKFKVKVTLRFAIYRQSVRLGVNPLETQDPRLFSTETSR
jgi:hypothetical protein